MVVLALIFFGGVLEDVLFAGGLGKRLIGIYGR